MSNIRPFFSILIPAYNVEKYINRCMDTVLHQTFADLEIIIVNDGSTDCTADILDKYQMADARVKVYTHDANSGLLAARHTAISNASGQYALFLDSDDYLDITACSKIHDVISRDSDNSKVYEFGYINEPAGDRFVNNFRPDNVSEAVLAGQYPPTLWNKCYSLDWLKSKLEYVERLRVTFGEDRYQTRIYLDGIDKIKYIDDFFPYHYQIGTGVSTGKIISVESLRKNIAEIKNIEGALARYYQKMGRVDFEQLAHLAAVECSEYIYWQFKKSDNSKIEIFEAWATLDKDFATDYCDRTFKYAEWFDGYTKLSFFRKIKRLLYVFLKG